MQNFWFYSLLRILLTKFCNFCHVVFRDFLYFFTPYFAFEKNKCSHTIMELCYRTGGMVHISAFCGANSKSQRCKMRASFCFKRYSRCIDKTAVSHTMAFTQTGAKANILICKWPHYLGGKNASRSERRNLIKTKSIFREYARF